MTTDAATGAGRICVVGSLNLDRTYDVPELPASGATVHAAGVLRSPGGKGANQAVAAARLGAEVQLIGAVGRDAAADDLLRAVETDGVDVSAIVRTGEPTGEAVILVDDAGENVIVVNGGANLALTPDAVHGAHAGVSIVVTGFEVGDGVVEAAARLAQTADALLVLNPSPVRPVLRTMLAPRTLLVMNEGELVALVSGATATPDDLARASEALGGSDLVVTRGPRGAIAYDAQTGAAVEVAARVVDAVDTSGCGDAFTGALVAALARGEALHEAVAAATDVGAFAATRRGTQSSYPTSAELTDWLEVQSDGGGA